MNKNITSSLIISMSLLSGTATAQITPEEGAKLLVWANPGENAEVAKYVAQKFEDKYNVSVEVKEVSVLGAVDQMIQDGGSTRVGDVFQFPHNMISSGVESGILMENLISSDRIKNDFIQSAVQASTYSDGKIYAFPSSMTTTIMFYNKGLLPTGISAFEELLEKNEELTNPSNNEYALIWDINNYYVSRAFITMYGAYEFGNGNTNPDDIGATGKSAIKGLESMLELKELTVKNSNDVANGQVRQGLFSDGKVAAIIAGPWAYDTFKNSGINLGVQALPTYKGKDLTTFSGFEVYGVSTFTQYPRAAQLFADYITSEEFAEYRLETANRLTPTKAFMAKANSNTSNEYLTAMTQQAKNTIAMPHLMEMNFLWGPLSGAVSDAWNKDVPPVDALTKAAKSINLQIQMSK
ncbi:extracellular solute-binding protein [Vibrio parahaemolyticus]|uniref:extracellular solute-binding protein n=1 Tax=Vibrio parahaemolyticus TaxID=670 RepID=UPI0015DED4F2|nr:extracellular solute-binding protein [Vibrio parahaemolyticus]HCM1552943.1 extracellular solute-binding protein [Vibrio parahaemolyticus]